MTVHFAVNINDCLRDDLKSDRESNWHFICAYWGRDTTPQTRTTDPKKVTCKRCQKMLLTRPWLTKEASKTTEAKQ